MVKIESDQSRLKDMVFTSVMCVAPMSQIKIDSQNAIVRPHRKAVSIAFSAAWPVVVTKILESSSRAFAPGQLTVVLPKPNIHSVVINNCKRQIPRGSGVIDGRNIRAYN